MTQRRASPHTIAAYRDTFRLLLDNLTAHTGTAPSALQISDRAAAPGTPAVIQRVLAIQTAQTERNLVTYLDHAEADALLFACDQSTRTGRRDHAMFALGIQTGLRISELTGLKIADVHLGSGPHVHCVGKGRKERRTPLLPPP